MRARNRSLRRTHADAWRERCDAHRRRNERHREAVAEPTSSVRACRRQPAHFEQHPLAGHRRIYLPARTERTRASPAARRRCQVQDSLRADGRGTLAYTNPGARVYAREAVRRHHRSLHPSVRVDVERVYTKPGIALNLSRLTAGAVLLPGHDTSIRGPRERSGAHANEQLVQRRLCDRVPIAARVERRT